MPKHYLKSEIPDWYVITGGPSSGKTTIVNELAKMGFITFPDAARVLIDKEIKKGRLIEEIRKNEANFQKRILKTKIKTEEKAPKNKIIFFDNAIPCSIAYYKSCGLDPKEALRFCQKGRYKKVFFLEQFPFEKDYARTEDDIIVKKLNKFLKECYENLGYKLISIPIMSKERRVQRILKEIKKS